MSPAEILSSSTHLDSPPPQTLPAGSHPSVCPGLFYAVAASDGNLFRIRTPGGYLTAAQAHQVARFAEQMAASIQITNRANLQFRTQRAAVPQELLQQLQSIGLAGAEPSVDHLRNVMASPTAGIDPIALIDTRPWVAALDAYLSTHPELFPLSAKFSIGLDGRESVSVGDRRNDIGLVAMAAPQTVTKVGASDQPTIGFRVVLMGAGDSGETGLWIRPQQVVRLVRIITQAAIDLGNRLETDPQMQPVLKGKPPRFRQILATVGVEQFLARLRHHADWEDQWDCSDHRMNGGESAIDQFPPGAIVPAATDDPSERSNQPFGIQAQRQAGYCAVGVEVPLGWITPDQLRALATLATEYGDGSLRLTPWQNLLVPNVPEANCGAFQQGLARIGLNLFPKLRWGRLVACAGLPGCQASATHTQQHALELAHHLESLRLERPITLHLTGCPKSCAYHQPSEITLLGASLESAAASPAAYHVYVNGYLAIDDAEQIFSQPEDSPEQTPTHFGRLIAAAVPIEHIPQVIQRLIDRFQAGS
ncbi:MAG: precorrin-3B synthase [Elainella sp. Prado103]|nr:precorrin-3B synthase [Elainella sp. Prado103]